MIAEILVNSLIHSLEIVVDINQQIIKYILQFASVPNPRATTELLLAIPKGRLWEKSPEFNIEFFKDFVDECYIDPDDEYAF